jgi:glutamine---fructose-6-phosphate transaminase (isomerizing)
MCGIVGYLGEPDGVPIALDCLKRLEYRGYDSAGVCAVVDGAVDVRRSVGRIANLEATLCARPLAGRPVIAHTRWATHGRPSSENAHPHVDCGSTLAVVHNGIIENHRALRASLTAEGHTFRSQTDTEVIAHLIEKRRTNGLQSAVRAAVSDLHGVFAIACIAANAPDEVVAARSGSTPLVIGFGDGEIILASDIPALLWRTRQILILEDGEMATLSRSGVRVERLAGGMSVSRAPSRVSWDADAAERGGYPHFMLKETFEQPEVVRNTLRDRIAPGADEVVLPELGLSDDELRALDRVAFVACGTSWHAGLVGKYLIESIARVPVEVDIASEFRYRAPVIDRSSLAVAISQSGETADTLAALREAHSRHARTLAICNVLGSSLSREAEGVLYTRAGLEIGVASTKAFTAQLAAVLLLAIKLGRVRGTLAADEARRLITALHAVPDQMAQALQRQAEVRALAAQLASSEHMLYLGRGLHYPLALEGALKLKEISYIHAEGYPAGEMKHGPIALIKAGLPVLAIATSSPVVDKVWSNVEEVKARGGLAIAVVDEDDLEAEERADAVLRVPVADYRVQPLLVALPLQLLAYHIGTLRGCDVDQPRNLAKSVTVE